MSRYVLRFDEVDPARISEVGGKGAGLAALARLEGVSVPPGFCITTAAADRALSALPDLDVALDRLARLEPGDREAIQAAGAALRQRIEGAPLPVDVAAAITGALDPDAPYAVRSSATAEDSPTTSFAGLLDSALDVVGPEAVLHAARRCWASAYSERALTYQLQRGLDPRALRVAVVVQRMVRPRASGVLFTADPSTGHRGVCVVEATSGLGEALVSGRVQPQVFKLRGGACVSRVEPGPPALTEAEALELAALGRRVEAALGAPQDIEWCLDEGGFRLVQARPITTLYPVPVRDAPGPFVYLSVAHQQMMTDAMSPLGLSLFQRMALRPMFEAGGRLFVDVTAALASAPGRAGLLGLMARSEPLMHDALRRLCERGDLLPPLPEAAPGGPPAATPPAPIEADPALVEALIAEEQASVAALARALRASSGVAALDLILEDIPELQRLLRDPRSQQVILAGMQATWWLNEQMQAWLGEKNAADALTGAVEHNVTSEMGLALLDVADALRPHPELIAALPTLPDEGFLDALGALPGGPEVREALRTWLERYGVRGVGEIDLARPRWSERPSGLVPLLLRHVHSQQPGARARRLEQAQQTAEQAERALLERLRAQPDGEDRAAEAKRQIDRLRAFSGFREYPKFSMVRRLSLYKQALLAEAERLARAGALQRPEDIFLLSLEELRALVHVGVVDEALLRGRAEAHRANQALTTPRVLTSEGEVVTGTYRREGLPAGALVGLAVSGGVVEGRARVLRDVGDAALEAGDILVTRFTDPSWTPLFISIRGLVTEVGGLMTHGSVIAREYGLPAVVGVIDATRRIRDGQRIRVHGAEGTVELL
ncbi:MAG: phosphoenolpyruvate synthase [Alphaproteobacteria bacterium]|nr:phosphoenolpyruvate synthase [Alphaproteobacteria bacterium]